MKDSGAVGVGREREKIWWPGGEERTDGCTSVKRKGMGGVGIFIFLTRDSERVMEMKCVGYKGLIFFHFLTQPDSYLVHSFCFFACLELYY